MEGLSQSGGISEDFTEEVTYCCVLKPKKKGRHDPGRGNSMYRRKEALLINHSIILMLQSKKQKGMEMWAQDPPS